MGYVKYEILQILALFAWLITW